MAESNFCTLDIMLFAIKMDEVCYETLGSNDGLNIPLDQRLILYAEVMDEFEGSEWDDEDIEIETCFEMFAEDNVEKWKQELIDADCCDGYCNWVKWTEIHQKIGGDNNE